MVSETALLQVGAMFAAIAVAGGVSYRLGTSVIPLYILAGMTIGPFGAGAVDLPHVPELEFIELGAELGIIFLLFYLGLEFSIDRLLANVDRIGSAGAVDLAINFPLGFFVGLAIGWSLLEAWLLAGIVYISSSAVITKSLIDRGWLGNPEAEPILGTLVFEDLVIAVYLAVTAALVGGAGDGPVEAAVPVAVALGAIGALTLLVYYGTAAFDRLVDIESDEQLVLRAVGVTVLVAGAAFAAGVSEAVAAFFVGMAISSTAHADRIERLLLPVRDVFAAVFFFWIGLVTDPTLFGPIAALLAVVVVLTAASKLASGVAGGRVYGLDDRRSLRVGLAMVTRGEFSLIIATVAAGGSGAVMTELLPAFAVAYVLVMAILGTLLMQLSGSIERRLGLAWPG
ncbi:MAG: cation:proton antiporter [Halobacteriales archaeon]